MSKINYAKGDATAPRVNKIICHICNDLGAWGAGFVLALSKRWEEPEAAYRQWSSEDDFKLGAVQFVQVEENIWVANMIGQHGLISANNKTPIRYKEVEKCLEKVKEKALELQASVHMPRIGCGLAGGKWEEIEPLIQKTLCNAGVSVTVYDFVGTNEVK